jgi:hypothetical protein
MKKILFGVFATLLASSLGVCSAQSLGEIAKKAAAEKAAKAAAEKDAKAPAPKVFTEKDLKPDPTAPAAKPDAPAPASTKTADGTKDAKPEAAKDAAKDETYWKGRMRTLQTKLADDEADLKDAKTHVIDVESFTRPDGTMTSTIANNLLKAQARRDTAIATVASDKRAIFNLEEEARKAGVPPGWLRW